MPDAVKYPPVVLADHWRAKLAAVPLRCFWAEEDEPMLRIPPYPEAGRGLPQSVALKYGVVRIACPT
jgi:hypothetical protein